MHSPQAPVGVDDGSTGRVVAATFVVLVSLVQVFLAAFVTPRFATIFADMGGGRSLPLLTVMALQGRWLFVGMGCVYALTALFVVQRKAPRHWLFAMLALLFLTIALSMIGLFLGLEIGTIIRASPPQ